MSAQVIDNPTRSEIHLAYLAPHKPEHWRRISQLVLTGGFGVEPNPHTSSVTERPEVILPEFKITWPTPELKEQDHKIFFEACQMIIRTLNLDDEAFSHSTLPKIFSVLQKSFLFRQLYSKVSKSQNNTVQHHIETVPTLVKTDTIDLQERFILRIVAVFHDIGKAFNIGRDQVHYHALIASNIISWFMDTYQNEFVHHLSLFDKSSGEKVISVDGNGAALNSREGLERQFLGLKNQITEIIRLHHVLEQIDKGVLDLETVAAIFESSGINPLVFGQFIIADGSSVIPDNEKYAKFLIQNLDALVQLVDLLAYQNFLDEETLSQDIKLSFAQSLQHIISEVASSVVGLPEKIQKIIREIADKIDTVLAVALLNLEVHPVPIQKTMV